MFFERKSNIDEFEAEALPHWNDLYRTALSQLRDEALAEDVLQKAYLKAWKSFHQCRKGSDCRAWLFRIMFNCIHDHPCGGLVQKRSTSRVRGWRAISPTLLPSRTD